MRRLCLPVLLILLTANCLFAQSDAALIPAHLKDIEASQQQQDNFKPDNQTFHEALPALILKDQFPGQQVQKFRRVQEFPARKIHSDVVFSVHCDQFYFNLKKYH